MGEEEGHSPGSDSRISQQHHQLRILSNREIPRFFFFKRGRSATCTYPIGLAIGLVFRLEPHIFVVSFELNVSPIAPPSTLLMPWVPDIMGSAADYWPTFLWLTFTNSSLNLLHNISGPRSAMREVKLSSIRLCATAKVIYYSVILS